MHVLIIVNDHNEKCVPPNDRYDQTMAALTPVYTYKRRDLRRRRSHLRRRQCTSHLSYHQVGACEINCCRCHCRRRLSLPIGDIDLDAISPGSQLV